MRRPLAAAALAAALLLSAGCSAEPTASPSASPTGPAAAQTPDGSATGEPTGGGATQPGGTPAPGTSVTAPAGGNARQVCETASKASAEAAEKFITELGAMMQASAAGDTAGADAARKKAEAALKSWSTALRKQAGEASDGQLKAVLNEIATEVESMRPDAESIDGNKLDALQQRLDALCGN